MNLQQRPLYRSLQNLISSYFSKKKTMLTSLDLWDRGSGGQVVSVLTFHSDDPSSNPFPLNPTVILKIMFMKRNLVIVVLYVYCFYNLQVNFALISMSIWSRLVQWSSSALKQKSVLCFFVQQRRILLNKYLQFAIFCYKSIMSYFQFYYAEDDDYNL